jgi:hypothetical protein
MPNQFNQYTALFGDYTPASGRSHSAQEFDHPHYLPTDQTPPKAFPTRSRATSNPGLSHYRFDGNTIRDSNHHTVGEENYDAFPVEHPGAMSQYQPTGSDLLDLPESFDMHQPHFGSLDCDPPAMQTDARQTETPLSRPDQTLSHQSNFHALNSLLPDVLSQASMYGPGYNGVALPISAQPNGSSITSITGDRTDPINGDFLPDLAFPSAQVPDFPSFNPEDVDAYDLGLSGSPLASMISGTSWDPQATNHGGCTSLYGSSIAGGNLSQTSILREYDQKAYSQVQAGLVAPILDSVNRDTSSHMLLDPNCPYDCDHLSCHRIAASLSQIKYA